MILEKCGLEKGKFFENNEKGGEGSNLSIIKDGR
jgi:hypothetical protein